MMELGFLLYAATPFSLLTSIVAVNLTVRLKLYGLLLPVGFLSVAH
jgi:hypothetical protein